MSIGRPRKYVNDYKLVEIPKKNGKGTRQKAVYCGKYYRFNMTDNAFKGLMIIFSALTVAWLALIFVGICVFPSASMGGVNGDTQAQIYVILPYICQLLPSFLVASKVIMLMVSPRDMERFQYEDLVPKLRVWLIVGVAVAGASFFGQLASVVLGNESQTTVNAVIILVIEAVIALICWFFIRVFDRYECTKSDAPKAVR